MVLNKDLEPIILVLISLIVIGKLMSPKLDYQDIQNPLLSKERSAKTALATKLNELISLRGLSQTEVADITGMTQPKVTRNKYPPHQPSSSLGLNGHAILWQ
jgi:hypothetical protein